MVISDPLLGIADRVVIVSFSTYVPGKQGHDPACLLGVGDHPFITRPTFVRYRKAYAVPSGHLEYLTNRAEIVLRERLRPDVLAAVRRGAGESRFTPEECRMVLAKQGVIE
jgi:hypothetical protein